jgi:RimJ/RimL family protein N-acetyltransferase
MAFIPRAWASAPTYDGRMADLDLPITTARLTLRPFTDGDADDLYAYQSIPEVARYLYWDARDRAASAVSLADKAARTRLAAEGDSLVLAAVRDGRVIGEVNLVWVSRVHRQGEIGFVFHPDAQGHGYATEAATAVLRLGFDTVGLHRIFGRCDARNDASARLMERLGMRREAHLRHNEVFKGEWGDEFVYAILDHEWRDGTAAGA